MKARWYRRLLSGRRRRERRQRIEIARLVEIVYQWRLASRLLGRRRPDRSEWRAICILVLIGRDLIRRDVVVIARRWGRLGGLLRRVIALPFPREVMPPDFQACAKPSCDLANYFADFLARYLAKFGDLFGNIRQAECCYATTYSGVSQPKSVLPTFCRFSICALWQPLSFLWRISALFFLCALRRFEAFRVDVLSSSLEKSLL